MKTPTEFTAADLLRRIDAYRRSLDAPATAPVPLKRRGFWGRVADAARRLWKR